MSLMAIPEDNVVVAVQETKTARREDTTRVPCAGNMSEHNITICAMIPANIHLLLLQLITTFPTLECVARDVRKTRIAAKGVLIHVENVALTRERLCMAFATVLKIK
jgi:hypothetical protein